MICSHGNRFIAWAAIRAISLKPAEHFDLPEGVIDNLVDETVSKTIVAVKAQYPDSYPASLFKNLTKCRALAKVI